MNEKGRNILPMIGFILIVAVLLGGFAMAKSFGKGVQLFDNKRETGISIKNNRKSSPLGGYSIDDSGSVSTSGMNEISISGVSSEISIETHNSDKVEAHFYGNVTTSNQDALPYLEVVREGNTAVVRVKYPNVKNVSINGKTSLDVKIPEDWAQDLEVSSVSGRITTQELTGENVKLNTTSGDIEVDNITADDIVFQSVSGSFNLSNLKANGTISKNTISGSCTINEAQAEKIALESTSGSTTIHNADADKVTSTSISGAVEVNLSRGSAEMATTSGEILVRFEEDFDGFSANSVSGGVRLEIPENSEFKVDINTISGEIRCNDFSMKILSSKRNQLQAEAGNGGSRIEIRTTSGSVDISRR